MFKELLRRSMSLRSRLGANRSTLPDDRVRIASEVAGLGMYEADLGSQTVVYSPELCEIFGIPAGYKSTIEESFKFVHPLDREKAKLLVERNRRAPDQQATRAELRIVRPNGDVRWILWSSRTFFAESSSGPVPVRTIGAAMDITARKRSEESLRRSEERLWLAIRSANLGTWDWDIGVNQINASARSRQLLHLTIATPTDQATFFSAVNPADRERLDFAIGHALSSGVDFHEDIRVTCPAGRTTWIDLRGRTRYDDEGRAIRMTGIVSDITENKQAEQALRESEQRFRVFFHNAGVGMAECDPEGRFTAVNDSLSRNFGYTCAQLATMRLYDLVYPEDRARYWKHFTDLMHSEATDDTGISNIEMRCLRKDGSIVWVQVTGAVITDDHGVPISSIKVIEDITQRKLAIDALLRSEKLASVGRMATTIAHELNNPLAAAINAIYLVLADPSLSSESRQRLSIADKELARLAQMAKQAIGFYREIAQPSLVAVETILDQVLDVYETKFSNKNIRVVRKYDSVPDVYVVAGELRQAVSSLVSNSFDSLATGGTLVLSTAVFRRNSDHPVVRITVADNGSGIPKEHLGQVFEAFFTTKQDFGTGLGLWMTHELIRRQAGHIRIRSQVGKGTVAAIWLPAERRGHHRVAA